MVRVLDMSLQKVVKYLFATYQRLNGVRIYSNFIIYNIKLYI